jgi:hypothetical protein
VLARAASVDGLQQGVRRRGGGRRRVLAIGLRQRQRVCNGSRCWTSALCAGSCVPLAKLGEACEEATGKSCDIDLTCDPTRAVCVTDPTLGAACSVDQLCSGTLVCEGQSGPIEFADGESAGSGTCQAPPASGPCHFDDDCSNRCVGVAPPDSPGQCMPRTALGARCTAGAKECLLGAYCGADGRCVSLPSLGQSCAANVGEGAVCLDSYCDPGSATCVAFLQAGDPCALLTCWSWLCKPRPPGPPFVGIGR